MRFLHKPMYLRLRHPWARLDQAIPLFGREFHNPVHRMLLYTEKIILIGKISFFKIQNSLINSVQYSVYDIQNRIYEDIHNFLFFAQIPLCHTAVWRTFLSYSIVDYIGQI